MVSGDGWWSKMGGDSCQRSMVIRDGVAIVRGGWSVVLAMGEVAIGVGWVVMMVIGGDQKWVIGSRRS